MTKASVQNMVTLIGWLASACKECPRHGTAHCGLCPSYDAGNILEQYKTELETSTKNVRMTPGKARFMCVLATLYRVEAARCEVTGKMKTASRSSKVANAWLRDLIGRGMLEMSEDGATVALTPLGLEFARAHTEKSKEGKVIKA